MRLNLIEGAWYVAGRKLTVDEAKDTALRFFEYVQLTPEWTEDDGMYFDDYWYGIADNWDVNIYRPDPNENDTVLVIIYPVDDDGNTQDEGILIFPKEDEDD